MSQGGTFIQNNLDDSDEEPPVENQQTRGGGQGLPAGGSNPSPRGGNDPNSAFLGMLGGGLNSQQNHPVSQGQGLGVTGSKQLADMLQRLSFEQGLEGEGDGGGGRGGGGGGVLGSADEQLLSLLQGLKGHQGSRGAGGAEKGQTPAVPLLSDQRGQIPHSGQLSGLAQFLTGSGSAGTNESSSSLYKNPDGGRGGEASRVGGQSSGQDPIQKFLGGERGGEFPNPFAMPQMFGGGGGIGQDGGLTVSGGNKPLSGLGGLGSGLTAGTSGLQSQASQLQAMMQMYGGAGQSPASGASGGVHPQTSNEDIKKLLAELKITEVEEKQNAAARRGINQDSNPEELHAAVTGDNPGKGRGQNMGQGVGQTGGPHTGQAGSQELGQVGGQGHGLNLGQAGLGGNQTSHEQEFSALMQLLQKQDQGQGQGTGQIPQGQGLGLTQAGLGKGQIPKGQQMQEFMQQLQNQGQRQGQNPMGGGHGGLGNIGRGLEPMGRGLGNFDPVGGGLGGLGQVGRGGFPGQVPGRGRGRGGGVNGDVLSELLQQEVARAVQNPDSRAAGPCTVIIADCSGSVQGQPLQDAIQFISDFIDGLEEVQFENGLEENIALITVGSSLVSIPQHLTNNYQKVRNIVNFFHAEGPTHLEMAFMFVMAVLADHEKSIYNTNQHYILPRVLVLTDGRPTSDVDVPGQVMNPEDQNLLVMKNNTTEIAHMVNEKTLARITCVPIGDCDVAFLEMLAGVTGGQVRCLGDAHPLSRNFLHHFIAGKMKVAGVKSDDLSSVLKAAEELTVADDADVESILAIINEDEPNIAEWKSKLQEAADGFKGGMGMGVPGQPGGLRMGGSGLAGPLSAGMGGAGMGGPGMAALYGQGMGGARMGSPGMGGAGMAAMMSQAMGGAGMGRAGMGGAGMAALMNQAMGGAGMGGYPGMGGLPGMGGFPGLYGMGGGQQPRRKSGFLRD